MNNLSPVKYTLAVHNGVTRVELEDEARRDEKCQLMNPWPGGRVGVLEVASGNSVEYELDTANGDCVVFEAESGGEYALVRK